MKRTDPMSLRQIIDMVVDRSSSKTEMLEHRASYLWPEIVGQGVNRYTTHRYVDHGTMHVYITSASLKNELGFHKAALIEQINRRVGRNVITSITIH